ncbi:MAG TPA: DUF427 domain-containing protein [Candidatus Dormibacteraeota bacterium]
MNAAARPFLIEDVVTGPPAVAASVRLERTAKRVRCFLGDTAVADSTHAMLCFETNRLAVYYFPLHDVVGGALVSSGRTYESPLKGAARYFDVSAGGAVAADAAWEYRDPLPGAEPGTRYVAFHWTLMDAWFEEDEEVFIHPRDPYHRIDVLQSSRHVEVAVSGSVVAESHRPRILFETSLPPRYYLPREDVRLGLLEPSTTRTGCAYKGYTTEYWALNGRDVAWTYATPPPEVGRIAGMIAFFNERVDITIDGREQQRPATPWS